MTGHSTIVGGSTADRLLNCPGSWQATLALPPQIRTSSEYADEGTAMHEVMTRLMNIRSASLEAKRKFDPYKEAAKLVGLKFYDRALTIEHVDTMVSPALEQLERLEAHYGGGFVVRGVEIRVAFPGIPGAFGTCDLILSNERWVLHVDWKFGQGVGVQAVTKEGAEEKVNAQLLFYAAGAMNSAKTIYAGRRNLAVAIIQPRGEMPLSHTPVSRKEIKWFVEDLQEAVINATEYDPLRTKGEHCRFAPCKIDCPLWTGPLLDLTALGADAPPLPKETTREVTPFAEYLARAKALADIAALFKKEVDEQLHAYLEAGGTVPGWRLKAKVKLRQWIDEDTVENTLARLGFARDEIWQSKLQTFQSADATAKRRGVKIPDNLRVAPVTNETTIATTDDPAPVVERGLAMEAFRAALEDLSKSA
jgi:hypothetical protein